MIHHFIDIHSAVLVLLFCYGSIIPIEIGVKLRPLSTLESFICIPSGSPPLVIYISKAAVAAIRRCGPELHRKNHCLTIDILLLLPLMQRINFPARSIAWWSPIFVRECNLDVASYELPPQKIVVVAGRKRSDSLFFYCSPSSDRQCTIYIYLYRIDVWCLHIQIDNDTFCIVEIAIQLREDEWNQWNIQINIFDFWFVFDINKMIKWTKFCDWWKSENVDCSNIV